MAKMANNKDRDYVAFMYNRENVHNCGSCPENTGSDGWQCPLPCGQQNCWVEAHCDSLERS